MFWFTQLGGGDAIGIEWVKARGAAQLPPRHGTAPTTKNHQVLNVKVPRTDLAEGEKGPNEAV